MVITLGKFLLPQLYILNPSSYTSCALIRLIRLFFLRKSYKASYPNTYEHPLY